jgi:hypothetical protein
VARVAERRRLAPDLPVGAVVLFTFVVVVLAFAGLFKLALAVVLLGFLVATVLRWVKGR